MGYVGTPRDFDGAAFDVYADLAAAAHKREEAARRRAEYLDEQLRRPDLSESLAATFRGARRACDEILRAASAELRARECFQAGLTCCRHPELQAGENTRGHFSRIMAEVVVGGARRLDHIADATLQQFASLDCYGGVDYGTLLPDEQTAVAKNLATLLFSALKMQGRLWTAACDPNVGERGEGARGERASLAAAASAAMLASLAVWRHSAADLVSQSAVEGLGEQVGREALACVRRKVSPLPTPPLPPSSFLSTRFLHRARRPVS